MAKKDYKDTVVLEVKDDKAEAKENVVEAEARDERAEEKSKLEKMSKDELIKYALRAKENLWSSHDQRDELEKFLRERDEKIVQLSNANRELEDRVSDSEKDKKHLDNQLVKAQSEIKSLEAEKGKVVGLVHQVTDLKDKIKNKDDAAKREQLNLERSHKAETDEFKSNISQLKEELKGSKAEIKKLKADLKKAEDRADAFEESFGEARDANFAGMIVRDIPREMGLGFEAADEKTKEEFEDFLSGVRERYLSVACGAIKAADDKILSQETAADELKEAEKELKDSESLEELAIQRKEAAKRKLEEKKRNFIEAKGEA